MGEREARAPRRAGKGQGGARASQDRAVWKGWGGQLNVNEGTSQLWCCMGRSNQTARQTNDRYLVHVLSVSRVAAGGFIQCL